jgi:hypothetical protein
MIPGVSPFLQKFVEVDLFKQKNPLHIFKEFNLGRIPYNFNFVIPKGYDYRLRQFYFIHAGRDSLPEPGPEMQEISIFTAPLLHVEWKESVFSRDKQNEPYYCRLVSTPGECSDSYGIVNKAPKDTIELNQFKVYNENISAIFSWSKMVSSNIPVQIYIIGDLIPEIHLEDWGE